MNAREQAEQAVDAALVLLTLFLIGGAGWQIASACDGNVFYSLDDAYISLSVAESVIDGTYGVNPGEASSPASSALWPLLLVPLLLVGLGTWSPLLLNVIGALGIVLGARRISTHLRHDHGSRLVDFAFGAAAIPVTNLVGLVWTGMEHVLHVWCVVAVLLGCLRTLDDGAPRWLWAALIAGPLLRYEALAVSLPVLAWLATVGYARDALLAGAGTLGGLAAFSGLLVAMGLDPVPSSVQAKSVFLHTSDLVAALLGNVARNLRTWPGIALAAATVVILERLVRGVRPAPWKRMVVTAVAAVLAHFVVGRSGWANRYEVWIVAFAVGMLWVSVAPLLRHNPRHRPMAAIVAALITALPAGFYVVEWELVALGASNIYRQPYQLHRFLVDQWQEPVAVNDLGWTSFRNDEYVLDLMGLADAAALDHRHSGMGAEWMDELARSRGVRLAIVHPRLVGGAPAGWVAVATMHTEDVEVTFAGTDVVFYAVHADAAPEIRESLKRFRLELPDRVTVELSPPRP